MKKFIFEDKAEDTDILAEDDLDLVEDEEVEQVNEVRYIDPENVDNYDPNEIEEVITASGEKRYKRKSSAQVDSKPKEPKELEIKEKDFMISQLKDMPYAKFFKHPKYGLLTYTADDNTYADTNDNFYNGDELKDKASLIKVQPNKEDVLNSVKLDINNLKEEFNKGSVDQQEFLKRQRQLQNQLNYFNNNL